jgi:hypothetical protein
MTGSARVTSREVTHAVFEYYKAKSPRKTPPSLRSPHYNSDIHGDVKKKGKIDEVSN